MRALRFLGNEKCDVAEVPIPVRKEGEILIKCMSCALCGSENKRYFMDSKVYEPYGGYVVPGHEMAGEVVDAGESKTLKKGDKVVIQIMDGCGKCLYCKNETYIFCQSLNYVGSTHAQYVSYPEKCVIKAPDDISYDMLVLLGGDTVGVASRVAKQLDLNKGKPIFVSGAGPIGMGVVAMLKHLGCQVIVSEPSEYRRNFIKEKTGADILLDPLKDNFKEELSKLTDGVGPETTIECSGNPKAQLEAFELTRCGGTVMLCGENYDKFELVLSDHIIHKELNVKGAFYFTAADFINIIGMYRKGFDVSGLVSHIVKLDDAPKAVSDFVKGLTGKVILHPNE